MKTVICSTGEICETYPKYLASKHWKQKKAEFYASDRFTGTCSRCTIDYSLQVHHLTYENIGDEKLEDLICLCQGCHRKEHGYVSSTAIPHWFYFNVDLWKSPRVKEMSRKHQGIFIDLLCEIFCSGLSIEDSDEHLSKYLRIRQKDWREAKAEFLREPEPLIYIEDGYIMNEYVVSEYHRRWYGIRTAHYD